MKHFKTKKAIAQDYIGWLVIAIVALVVILGAYLVLKGKLSGGIDYIKNFLRFGNLLNSLG